MKRPCRAVTYSAAFFALLNGAAAWAEDAITAADFKLLAVAERVQTANAFLCDRLAPGLGVALQSRDQFHQGSDPGFDADVAFAAILPDSPAAAAGLVDGDGLVAIAGRAIAKRPDLGNMPLRDSAAALLAEQPAGSVLRLTVVHDGHRREVEIVPQPQCRALVEVLLERGRVARSDGRVIQLGTDIVRRAGDEELAVIFAHELAHSVLHHRDRLSREGVSKGITGEFGRDRELNAQAEIEADRLSVHLLANAGYDPGVAAAFWRSPLGRELGGGFLRSRIYSSPEDRAAALEREVADFLAGGAPSWPGHLLARR